MCVFVLLATLIAGPGGAALEGPARAGKPAPGPVADGGGDTLWVDLQRSVIRWKGTKFWGLGKHEGIVRLAAGHVQLCGEMPCSGAFVIDMRSIEVTDIPEHDPKPYISCDHPRCF